MGDFFVVDKSDIFDYVLTQEDWCVCGAAGGDMFCLDKCLFWGYVLTRRFFCTKPVSAGLQVLIFG